MSRRTRGRRGERRSRDVSRVLLVTHEVSRTGAPRVALLVARALVDRGASVRVVSRSPGPLLEEFAQVAPTSLSVGYRIRGRVMTTPAVSRLSPVLDAVLATVDILRSRPDLVYVNSAAAAAYLRPARWLRRRVVLHVHESGPLASGFLVRARLSQVPDDVALVACSPSVRTELAALVGRPESGIVLLPSVPDDATVLRRSHEEPDHAYAAEDLVVGCCGSVEHRKGADLWLACAERVRQALPDRDVRFVWVGEPVQPPPGPAVPGVEFIGPSSNPYAHMRRFDVATLPSRDDPFPLVVLEAMLVGTPVVAFAVGGVAEQIGDAGLLVAPADVDGFAAAVVSLLVDDERRLELGRAARERATSLYSTEAFARGVSALVDGERAPEATT